MANFDNEILNPEEQSGFTPGMDGDETFSLEKTGEYNGVMPDFTFDGELTDDEAEVNPVLESAFEPILDQEGSSASDDSSASEEYPVDAVGTEVPVEDGEQLNDAVVEDAGAQVEELNGLADMNDSPPEEEPLRIDDDLKALLTSDLQTRKSKLEAKKAKKEEEVPPAVARDEFPTFDDDGDAHIIDLSELEADRPSTFHTEENFPKPEEEPKDENLAGMQISKHKKKPAVKPDETGEVKEPKIKKPLPLFLITIAGIAAVFLISVGVALYLFLFQPGKMFDFEKKKVEIAKAKSIEKPKKVEKPVVKQEVKPPVKPDSISLPPKDSATAKTKDTVKSKKIVLNDKVPDKEVVKEQDQKVAPPPVVKKVPPKKVTTPDTAKKPIVAVKPPVSKPKPEEVPQPIVKQPVKPTIKEPVKPTTKEPVKQTSDELYTIQIYSSPNLDDAQEWLTDLKSKNVNGATISEQKIRDKKWYRVRFGSFKTRQEASDAAAKLGYAQSWVDRVK